MREIVIYIDIFLFLTKGHPWGNDPVKSWNVSQPRRADLSFFLLSLKFQFRLLPSVASAFRIQLHVPQPRNTSTSFVIAFHPLLKDLDTC